MLRLLSVSILLSIMVGALAAGGPPAPVPKTGQTTSYRARDDGALEKGVAWPYPRFSDHGNGTVTDLLTGLTWLLEANCFGARSWINALNDANTLASGSCGLADGSAAGDWRLPNVRELHSLVNYGANSPSLPYGHPFLNVQADNYWTSTSYVGLLTNWAWRVGMVYGNIGTSPKSNAMYVWPVSGETSAGVAPLPKTGQADCFDALGTQINCAGTGQDGEYQHGAAWPAPCFSDDADGTVTDRLTGLVWLKDAYCFGNRQWIAALSDASNLASGSCGLSDGSQANDWRLPNVREFLSLIDFGRTEPTLPPGHPFLNVNLKYPWWTSTTYRVYIDAALTIPLLNGGISTTDKTYSQPVWAVRDPLAYKVYLPVARR
jgi:hypothetical protein